MVNVIESILANGGWQALAVLGSLWLIRMALDLMKRSSAKEDVNDHTTAMLVGVVASQTEIEKQNADTAREVSETLAGIKSVLDAHKEQIADLTVQQTTIKTELSGAVQAMHNTAERRDKALEILPVQVAGKVSEVMADELKKLPGEISAEINPALAEIASQVKALSEKIELVVPSQIKELVTPEFEELKAKVNRLLAIMDKQQQAEPTIDAAQPAEETKPNE